MPRPELAPVYASASRPRVSVVMPTYNRSLVIGDTLRTVVSQSFSDMEILVKSDGEDRATEAIVRGIGDARVRYSRTAGRRKMPGILNDLIAETRGHHILVLHDHDLYDARLVEKMTAMLEANPGLAYVHTAVKAIDAEGTVLAVYSGDYSPITPGDAWLSLMLSRFDSPVCALTMVPRRVYERNGLYDDDYGFISDVEMWMRLACVGDVGYLSEPLISCRSRETGHEYAMVNWETVDAALRIHAAYEAMDPLALSAVRRAHNFLRNEYFRATQLLAVMKQSRCALPARLRAREYLRGHGGLLTRGMALLIPTK